MSLWVVVKHDEDLFGMRTERDKESQQMVQFVFIVAIEIAVAYEGGTRFLSPERTIPQFGIPSHHSEIGNSSPGVACERHVLFDGGEIDIDGVESILLEEIEHERCVP